MPGAISWNRNQNIISALRNCVADWSTCQAKSKRTRRHTGVIVGDPTRWKRDSASPQVVLGAKIDLAISQCSRDTLFLLEELLNSLYSVVLYRLGTVVSIFFLEFLLIN
jgi:hypothetical protein